MKKIERIIEHKYGYSHTKTVYYTDGSYEIIPMCFVDYNKKDLICSEVAREYSLNMEVENENEREELYYDTYSFLISILETRLITKLEKTESGIRWIEKGGKKRGIDLK